MLLCASKQRRHTQVSTLLQSQHALSCTVSCMHKRWWLAKNTISEVSNWPRSLPADMSTLKTSLQVRIWPLTCCVILSPCAKIRSCPVAVSNINTLCRSSLPLRQHSYTRLATQAASDMHDPGSKQMQAPASQPVCMASSLLQSQLNCQLQFRYRTKTAYEDRQSHVKLQCVLLQCHE